MRGSAILFVVLALAAPALADDEAARRMYSDAETAYRLSRFDEAARLFESTYQASRRPSILFDIAQSYRRWFERSRNVEHLRHAVDLYREFLREAPTAPQRPIAEKLLPDLEKALASEGQGQRDAQETARLAFVEGTRRYALGEFQLALESFKKAYLKFESPALLFNIAQCQKALGHDEEALRLFRRYLLEITDPAVGVQPGDPVTIEEVKREIAALEERIKTAKLAVPARVVAPPAPPVAVAAPKPVFKRWWFWTAIGGVAAGVALGVGLGVGLQHGFSATLPEQGPGMASALGGR